MACIGILYTLHRTDINDAPVANPTAELHINYLKTISSTSFRKNYDRSLDIGIMLNDNVRDIESLCIYFPFKVTKIEDLVEKIKDPALFCTLFNGDFTICNITEHPLFYEVRPNDNSRIPF